MHAKIMTIAVPLLAGTAVLGSAGAATAASPADGATSAVTGAVTGLPMEEVAKTLPAGTAESLAAGQNALASGAATLSMTADQALPAVAGGGEGGGLPGGDLLGGLPVAGDAAKGGLPTDTVTGVVTGAITGAAPGGLPGGLPVGG
ncbi:ATP-binding protein [Streptomyces piniterrae]|uniref:ATP-binding protein n=1 Tax=Streptomyces piniterrae TaxID=2571125 RepID=UPI0016525D1E|nr:ATP-binding protein [Streptomyces piniterrae]